MVICATSVQSGNVEYYTFSTTTLYRTDKITNTKFRGHQITTLCIKLKSKPNTLKIYNTY